MKTDKTRPVPTNGTVKYNLRPRRKPEAGSPLVNRVMLVVTWHGTSYYRELIFTGTGLTENEMFTRGFVGDVDLPGAAGVPIEAEIECGPVGEFPGDPVKGLVFRFRSKDSGALLNAQVSNFNYTKPVL